MTTAKPDLLSLATRFALLPDAQRKAFLTKLDAAGIDFRVLPIPPRAERTASVPASFAQTRLWLHARMIDEPAAYHITERLHLDGALDANALRLSCDALIARHEALRTTFAESADGVLQTVHAPSRCPWHASDVSALPVHERETRAAAIAQADEAQAFDLSLGPLMRAHLIRLDATTHWLALTTHHIVSDGWSADVLLAELASFYHAYAKNEAVSLTPLPIQYADYALWQRRWLDAGERERQLAFWRGRLDASRDVLMLPGAAPRPAQRSARGARHRFVLDAALVQQVKALANAERATPFAVLLAALNAVLARSSGEAQIQIGVPAANRERGEVAGLVGFFVNTLTLATSVAVTQPFAALVGATQQTLIDAQSHQDVPFEQVVEALGVVRSASHHPLFQVMAAYGARRRLPSLADVRMTELPSGAPFAKFDLTLSFEERDDGSIDAYLIYALDLFEADAVERLAGRFVELLSNATAASGTAVGDLQWLPAAERTQLDAWNSTALSQQEAFRPVHQRVADHAHARPDARGVADLERSLTRGEVDARATRLAQRLVAAGVSAEMRVGVALGRSVDLLVGLIAALKSGGAFVPLDPSHPRERLAQILDDAQITHVITERASLAALPASDRLRLWLIDEAPRHDDPSTLPTASTAPTASIALTAPTAPTAPIAPSPPPASLSPTMLPTVSPYQAAYVIYTSGSTGKPKGVQHSTGGYLLWAAQTMKWTFDWKPTDVFWCTADIGWITGHSYITYGPLTLGGTQVVFEGVPTYPNAGRFWDMIAKHKVSLFYTAPTAIRSLIKVSEADEKVHPKSYDLSTLRIIGTVGEPINPEAWVWYHENVGGGRCPIVDTWWQTETGGHMITPLPGATPLVPGSCTLPLPGIMAAVVDETGQDVPNGQGGILVVKRPWPSMLRNVWGDPDRYKKSYFPEELGGKLYLAGDGAVRDKETGYFTIMGRIDDVLNVSGHRLGTMEIESALVSNPIVAEAAVVGRPDATTGEAVCAFVVLKRARPEGEEAVKLANELRNWVAKEIGPIAKPKDIRFGENLPKTRSGKIMRRLLRSLAKGEEITQDVSTLENPAILDQLGESL